jgi:hypothetical protein
MPALSLPPDHIQGHRPRVSLSAAARQRHTRLAAPLCIAVSALCFYASTGPLDWGRLAWLAPVPMLVLRSIPGRAVLQGFLAYALGLAGSWAVYASFVPSVTLAVFFALLSTIYGTTMAIAAWLTARVGTWQQVLVHPLVVTAVDTLLFHLSADAAGFSLAYTQTPLLPLLQTARSRVHRASSSWSHCSRRRSPLRHRARGGRGW